MKTIFDDISEMQKNIHPLNINGLKGRVLKMPASKKSNKREILLIYGHHSSIERMYGIAEAFTPYGSVTMPDLPGFGGMDSFYRIGMKPTLDNLADYLATVVKLKYRRKKVTIVGMSLGFVIATRMLQRYPELTSRVELMISLVGFSHKGDYTFSKKRMFTYKFLSGIFARRIPAWLFFNLALHPTVLRTFYARTHNAKNKFKKLDAKTKKQMIDFEVILWRNNDVRTYFTTSRAMLTLDNCKQQVDLPVHHVSVKDDQYFDNAVVEQHMQIIFNDFYEYPVVLPSHAPSIIASKAEAEPFVPEKLKEVLSS